jgi:hemerythrin-like metal-binding protein
MTYSIVWQDQWNTNIPEIDERHVEMVRQLNAIAEVLNQPDRNAQSDPVLDSLLNDYLRLTREHFTAEEQQMLETDFPDYTGHKREHVMLLAELNQLVAEINSSPSSIDMDTLRALKRWLVAHITSADKAYADYWHARP